MSGNTTVEIKDVMVKLGGGILFLLLAGFLINTILDIDITNQCRLHYNGTGAVTTVFGLSVEGERKFVECIQYNEYVAVEIDPDPDIDDVIKRTFTVINLCNINGTPTACKTVISIFSWEETKDKRNTPGPNCKDGEYVPQCGGLKLYHAQDKPIPGMLFGLNAFLLIFGMLVFMMGGYKLILYVKQAPK